MDDLKKACDESSKETTLDSVYGTLIHQLAYAGTLNDKEIEKKIGSTLLRNCETWDSHKVVKHSMGLRISLIS